MTTSLLSTLSLIWIGCALVVLPILLRVRQPYGRHRTDGWGWVMDNRWGWVVQEAPSLIAITVLFFMGTATKTPLAYLLWSLWAIHYTYRSFVFPYRTHTTGKKIPVIIVIAAICFNLVNAPLNGYYLGHVLLVEGFDFLYTIRFWIGIVVFLLGMLLNISSDNILLNLRNGSTQGYKIPYGGVFKWVSCPNYLGEMIEWIGFAILAGGLPAVSFAVWTVVNLTPRALDHHRWYKAEFADYPSERKALVPFVL
jgi:3-oxo-5-alpha-steroid 4-dehydrogenase 1